MPFTIRLVVLPIFTICSFLCLNQLTLGNDATDEALAAAYNKLKSDPSLKDEKTRHQKLMQMADQYNKLAEVAFQSTEDLEKYAYKVRTTGLLFRTSLPGVKRFHKDLKVITEHPAFKNFQKYAGAKKHFDTVIGLGSRFQKTLNNPDLPPSARNAMEFLHTLGTGLEQLGKVPLAGPVLEGYGKIANGLGDTMNNLAGKTSATAKAGVFSLTEERELLGGLPKGQYIKTPLWHRGIPVVHEWPYAQGKDRFYLQMPDDKWVGVDYDEIASIAADYYLTEKKNPDVKTIWEYIDDQDARDSLRFAADTELEFKRIERILGDVPGVNRRLRYSQFTSIESKIKRWHRGLGLPLEYTQLDRLIRIEYENPGVVGRTIRSRVVRAYPGFAEFLTSLKEDPMSMNMEVLLKRFTEYRAGEHLRQHQLAASCFIHVPADLPKGWWHVNIPQNAKLHNDGIPWMPYHSATQWRQKFNTSRDQGFVLQKTNGPWWDPNNRKRRFSDTWVVVHIDGPYTGEFSERSLQLHLDYWIKQRTARYVNSNKKSVLLNYTQGNGSQHYIKLCFVHQNCTIYLQLSGRPDTNSDPTEEMALHFGKCIARHLNEHFGVPE